MNFLQSFLGYREFLEQNEIKSFIRNSTDYSVAEDDDIIRTLPIFETSKQKTWIISTSKRLYCTLDDKRKHKAKITWSLPKKELVDNNNIILDIKVRDIEGKKKTGLIDFGYKHQRWYYSRKLLGTKTKAQKKIIAFLEKSYKK